MSLFFLIALGSSIIGSVCGIGGGVIIKPLLISTGALPVTECIFLSGCTVLSMSLVSVLRNLKKGIVPKKETCLFTATGAAAGGIAGRLLLHFIVLQIPNPAGLGIIQEFLLLSINVAVLILYRKKPEREAADSPQKIRCVIIGLVLGLVSSFLGIGGGPLNIIVLLYSFSMSRQETVVNSLYIIFFSQLAATLFNIVTLSTPPFQPVNLLIMCAGGVLGAYLGRALSFKISDAGGQKIFTLVVLFIMGINIFNILRFIIS
jgi:uncharacterized membrane protein YfcA